MGLGSVHHTSLLLLPPQKNSPHSSPVPAWDPSCGRLFSLNLSNVSPFQGLQLFTNCSRVDPFHEVVHRSCQKPAPAQISHRVTASFRRIPLLCRGVLPGLQVEICSTVDLHGLQRHSLPHHGLLHGLQRNFCSRAWGTSRPSFCTDLGGCRLLLSHVLTPLSSCNCTGISPSPFFPPPFFNINMLSQRLYHHF